MLQVYNEMDAYPENTLQTSYENWQPEGSKTASHINEMSSYLLTCQIFLVHLGQYNIFGAQRQSTNYKFDVFEIKVQNGMP